MGVTTETWRVRIGTFSQPRKTPSTDIDSLKPKHMGLCIRLLLFFLLDAQCVETNPGPTTKGRGDKSRVRRGTVDAELPDVDLPLSQPNKAPTRFVGEVLPRLIDRRPLVHYLVQLIPVGDHKRALLLQTTSITSTWPPFFLKLDRM